MTRAIPAPVARVSKRCIPVWRWPTGGTILMVVSPLRRAALASAKMRALSAASAVRARIGAGSGFSSNGTESARSSRKNLPELTSSSLTMSVYSPGRNGRSKARGIEPRAAAVASPAGRSNL